jgi:hypothetical protein
MKTKLFLLMMTMGLLSLFTGCKSKKAMADEGGDTPMPTVLPVMPQDEKVIVDEVGDTPTPTEQRTMPQGRLLRVEYSFQGMRMAPFRDFDLRRSADGSKSTFSFHHVGEVNIDGVPDSLFDAARRIIEEERMYEYASSYGLSPEIGQRMLDGYRWSFDAEFENNESISSSGRHVSPEGKGLNRMEELLSNAAKGYVESTLDR